MTDVSVWVGRDDSLIGLDSDRSVEERVAPVVYAEMLMPTWNPTTSTATTRTATPPHRAGIELLAEAHHVIPGVADAAPDRVGSPYSVKLSAPDAHENVLAVPTWIRSSRYRWAGSHQQP